MGTDVSADNQDVMGKHVSIENQRNQMGTVVCIDHQNAMEDSNDNPVGHDMNRDDPGDVDIVPKDKPAKELPTTPKRSKTIRNPKKKTCSKRTTGAKRRKIKEYTLFFDEQHEHSNLKHKIPTKMLFKSATEQYFVRNKDEKGGFGARKLCTSIEEYDDSLLRAVRELPDEWIGPSVGDVGDEAAPDHLCTKVRTLHQQHTNGYCLTYSLASALFYCGFRLASEGMKSIAERLEYMHFDQAIDEVREFMKDIVPLIGLPTLFGKRPNTHSRKMRCMSWDELFLHVSPYPTIVIPCMPGGQATHAFCVVDDLIFDSSTSFALKLCADSVKWIFREIVPDIYQVLRFDQKTSPKGVKISERYDRKVVYHWDHPSR